MDERMLPPAWRSIEGLAYNQLGAQQQSALMLAGSLAAQAQYPCLDALWYEQQKKNEREKFYRSCSQNWLNAMVDVELGPCDWPPK